MEVTEQQVKGFQEAVSKASQEFGLGIGLKLLLVDADGVRHPYTGKAVVGELVLTPNKPDPEKQEVSK